MKKLLILLTFSLLSACSKDNNAQPANGELAGTYNVIIDPVRCSMPSTTQISVTKIGETYSISTYEKILAEKIGDEYKLTLDGKEFGKYVKDTYRDIDGQKEGMVLYLRYENLEFMGNK